MELLRILRWFGDSGSHHLGLVLVRFLKRPVWGGLGFHDLAQLARRIRDHVRILYLLLKAHVAHHHCDGTEIRTLV